MKAKWPVIPLILVTVAVLTMIALGIWQLQRKTEKEALFGAAFIGRKFTRHRLSSCTDCRRFAAVSQVVRDVFAGDPVADCVG